jgi:NADH-quinone oxidoreductase subunit L
MNYASYIALIPLLPLAGFVLLGIFGRKYFKNSSGIIGTVLLLVSATLSLYTAYNYFFVDGKVGGSYQTITAIKFTWLSFSENVSIDMGIILDPISVMMLVVVTFVSLMVHIFSLGYMKGEERFPTYYAFLGLFTFFNVRVSCFEQSFPDIYVLGTGGCILLLTDWLLLRQALCSCRV